jgi:hypothetical protein
MLLGLLAASGEILQPAQSCSLYLSLPLCVPAWVQVLKEVHVSSVLMAAASRCVHTPRGCGCGSSRGCQCVLRPPAVAAHVCFFAAHVRHLSIKLARTHVCPFPSRFEAESERWASQQAASARSSGLSDVLGGSGSGDDRERDKDQNVRPHPAKRQKGFFFAAAAATGTDKGGTHMCLHARTHTHRQRHTHTHTHTLLLLLQVRIKGAHTRACTRANTCTGKGTHAHSHTYTYRHAHALAHAHTHTARARMHSSTHNTHLHHQQHEHMHTCTRTCIPPLHTHIHTQSLPPIHTHSGGWLRQGAGGACEWW